MQALRFIFKNLDQYTKPFYVALTAGILAGISAFLIPVALAEFTKEPLTHQNVFRLICVLVGLYLFSLVVAYMVRGKGEAMAFTYAHHIRLKYFRKLCSVPTANLQKIHSGYSLSLVNKVSDGMTDLVFPILWTLVPGLFVACLFFVFIAQESMLLALINLVIVIVFLIIASILSRRMVPLAGNLNRQRASLLESYVDFMANIVTVKKLGVYPYVEKRLQANTAKTAGAINSLQDYHARRWFFLHSLFGAAYIGTIGFLVWQIGQGKASVALLILFVAAYGTMRNLIEQLTENIRSLMEMRAYISQLEEITDYEHDNHSRHGRKDWQAITFQDVTFRYEDAQEITIPAFSLKRGQKVAITGKSGQGKSTFISLFADSLQPKTGSRRVDDDSYETITQSFFQEHIALSSQDIDLFNLSVRENLTLGKDISDTALTGYLGELDMAEWLAGLQDGLSTIVGEKGVKLSAGQKQRLSILRTILLGRDINILDEPTSHLDAHTESVVTSFLERHLAGKSAIIITHRPVLQKLASDAYVMQNHTLTPQTK